MFYRILPFFARIFGVWAFDLIAKGIAAGYFFFAPRRVMVSVRFYRALFPQRTRAYHFWCTWNQFQNFTSVYLDRYRFHEVGDISYTNEGWEHVENALDRKTGGIVLMSHLGNWEIAAHLMKQKREQMPLILFMGQRAKAHIERIQKEDLRRRGIRIVAVEKNWGTSFDLLEGLRFIQDGGLVSMTGDQSGIHASAPFQSPCWATRCACRKRRTCWPCCPGRRSLSFSHVVSARSVTT